MVLTRPKRVPQEEEDPLMPMCALRNLVAVVIRQLPWLETREDLQIVLEIACGQAAGTPLTAKELVLSGVGAPATVSRRIRRLVERDVVVRRASISDHRRIHFVLTAKAEQDLAAISRKLEHFAARERLTPGAAPALRAGRRAIPQGSR